MLRGIRKASANWLGRAVMAVVLGLIAVSFAIWGIGDIFRGFGRSTVAKIGGTDITIGASDRRSWEACVRRGLPRAKAEGERAPEDRGVMGASH